MNIVVLAAPGSWYVRDLQRAAAGLHTVLPVAFSNIRSRIGDGRVNVDWPAATVAGNSCVLVRTMPPGSLEQVVFRMDALGQLAAAGVCVINSARAIEAAVDKYLALARLQAAGLAVPPTVVCQTVDDAMMAFEELGGDVVIKPLFGGEGRGICRAADTDLAFRTFKTLSQISAVLYVQQFVPHEGCDWRLFVLGERVFGMRRRNPLDWRTNISRGATAEPLIVDDELADMALRAARAIGAEIAGVDVLPARDGRRLLLEVNAVPGWQALARVLDVDVADCVLNFLVDHIANTSAASRAGVSRDA